jgi:hypothetical protein
MNDNKFSMSFLDENNDTKYWAVSNVRDQVSKSRR